MAPLSTRPQTWNFKEASLDSLEKLNMRDRGCPGFSTKSHTICLACIHIHVCVYICIGILCRSRRILFWHKACWRIFFFLQHTSLGSLGLFPDLVFEIVPPLFAFSHGCARVGGPSSSAHCDGIDISGIHVDWIRQWPHGRTG